MTKYVFALVFILTLAGLIIFFGHRERFKQSEIPEANEYSVVAHVGDIEREYIIYAPAHYNTKTSNAAVIVLHGGGESAQYIMDETGWTSKSDQKGFLAVFPEGTRPDSSKPAGLKTNQQTWSDGSGRFPHHEHRNIEDIAFMEKVIDNIISSFGVDSRHIFVTGFSNGASMTLRVGVELSDRVAAIAPVAGGLWVEEPKLNQPVSLLYISGTKDPLPKESRVRFNEETVAIKAPVQNLASVWAEMIECPTRASSSEKNNVRKVVYSPCKEGHEVNIYSIEGLGHVWPGGKTFLEQSPESPTNIFYATDIIWEFFETYLNQR